jgi:hypothetical protein
VRAPGIRGKVRLTLSMTGWDEGKIAPLNVELAVPPSKEKDSTRPGHRSRNGRCPPGLYRSLLARLDETRAVGRAWRGGTAGKGHPDGRVG